MSFHFSLKKPVASFEYDIATYCELLLSIIGKHFPPDLEYLQEEIEKRAAQKEQVRPDKFDDRLRVYVIGPRLDIPFVLVDQEGSIATWCHWFARANFSGEYFTYGNMSNLGPIFPGQKWNEKLLQKFNEDFGFIPVEELGLPFLLIFNENKLDDRRPLALWQVCFLLSKFRTKNLVDWPNIVKYPRYRYVSGKV